MNLCDARTALPSYNDELLGGDERTFEERLYKTDYTGSKQYEEEIDKMHYEDECTFAPTLWVLS